MMLNNENDKLQEKEQEKEDNKLKTYQIFNIAERPVMKFISKFLEEPVSVIFKEELQPYVEPLILLPVKEYKEGVCIKFKLKSNTSMSNNKEYSNDIINKIIVNEKVKEGIGFLWFCIKEVFNSLVSSTMINKNTMDNVTIELNENTWEFYLKYSHELSQKKRQLDLNLIDLIYIKTNIDKFPDTLVNDINEQFMNVVVQINDINNKFKENPEILEEEKRINNLFKDKVVMGIFVEEMLETDLPKLNMRPTVLNISKQLNDETSDETKQLNDETNNETSTETKQLNDETSEETSDEKNNNVEEELNKLFV